MDAMSRGVLGSVAASHTRQCDDERQQHNRPTAHRENHDAHHDDAPAQGVCGAPDPLDATSQAGVALAGPWGGHAALLEPTRDAAQAARAASAAVPEAVACATPVKAMPPCGRPAQCQAQIAAAIAA